MSEQRVEICPVCRVKIETGNGDKVIFSSGSPGTRAKLWARVCQYVEKPGCINQEQEAIGTISANDYYKPIV